MSHRLPPHGACASCVRALMLLAAALFTASGAAAQSAPDNAVDALRSPEVEVRRRALEDIRRAGNPEAAGAVAVLAGDADDGVQREALDTLLLLLLHEGAPREETASRAFEAGLAPVRPVPATAYASVVQAMRDDNPGVRLNAAFTFGILAASPLGLVPEDARAGATTVLSDMLHEESVDARVAALDVIGRLYRASPDGPPPSPSPLPEPLIEALVASMNQPDPREQAAAMEALGRARETRVLDSLNERLRFHREEGPTSLAVAALDALARIADPSSVEMIRTLATDRWAMNGDPYVSVLFARERLLHDGSTESLKRVADDRRLGPRARAYLAELGAAP